MVSPFTIGLFAPLPLAMMIPFMATQSLAMGEAFGKAYQFGKRKISSMTNEEFNKLSIQDLMDAQTSNIKSLIPMLSEQMADSQAMQVKIFAEMTKLVPSFLEGLNEGSQDIITKEINREPSEGSIIDRVSHIDTSGITKWLEELTKATAYSLSLMPAAFAHPTPPPANVGGGFVPPEFGDQSPPNERITNDPEFVRATNEIAYREAQRLKEQKERERIAFEKYKTKAPSTQAIRRVTIAESGNSPAAAAAIATFKRNIDNWVRKVKIASDAYQAQKRLFTPYTNKQGRKITPNTSLKTRLTRDIEYAVQKLGALRIKFRSHYGINY